MTTPAPPSPSAPDAMAPLVEEAPVRVARWPLAAWSALALLGGLVAVYQPVAGLVRELEAAGAPSSAVAAFLGVPVGVFAIVFLRLVVGLDTFGLFAPLVLAMALRQMGLAFGLAAFVAVLLLMTPVRILLEKAAILSIARTGIVVALSALVFLVVWRLKPASASGGIGSLGLPLFLLAGSVERFVSAQMDQSTHEATKQSLHTIVAVVLVYLLLTWRGLQDVLVAWPDLVAATPVALFLLGRYTGLRLYELVRFRPLWARRG